MAINSKQEAKKFNTKLVKPQSEKPAALDKFGLIGLAGVGVVLILTLFGFLNFYIGLAVFFVFIFYFFFRSHIWLLLLLASPALILGQIIRFEVTSTWIYEMSLSELLILAVAALFVLDGIFRLRHFKIKANQVVLALLVYLVLTLLSFWEIESFRYFIYGAKIIVFAFLAYFLSYNYFDSARKIKYFIYSLAVTALILSGQIFYKFYELKFTTKIFFERNFIIIPTGPLALVSAILVLLVPLLLAAYFTFSKNDKGRIILFLAFVISLLAAFLTLGKGALLSLAIGLIYLLVIKIKEKRLASVLFGGLFVIILYLFFSFYFTGLFSRLGRFFVDSSTQFRVLEYQAAWKLIKAHPWFGLGAGQQLLYYGRVLAADYKELANNYLIQAMLDLGVLGLAAILFVIGALVRNARRIMAQAGSAYGVLAVGFVASMIVALINGLVEVTFFAMSYGIIFWLLAGTFASLENSKNYEKDFGHRN
jgi:O-antigen ligase